VIGVILVAIIVAIPVFVLLFAIIILGVVFLATTGFSITTILGTLAIAALIFLVIAPFLLVFEARYWTRLYDSAAPVAEDAAPGV
jgi:membrane protein implicated in regulation of membrane protease activity